MSETAGFPKLVAESGALTKPVQAGPITLRDDPGFHTTLACVERAAELIRSLQHENEVANRQLATLRDQLRREKDERQSEADKLEQLIRSWHGKVKVADTGRAEANALAVAAVTRCEEMAAAEIELQKRLSRAEARAVEAENHLVGLQKAIEFELSSLLP